MRHADLIEEPCSIARPLAILADRWTLVILRQAFAGIRRFDDFQASLGISRSRLADRLDRLVEHGILRRVPYKDIRTRHEYRLTDKGHDLYPVLMAVRQWGDRHMDGGAGAPWHYRHRGCGGESTIEHRCSDCGEEITARDVVLEPGPGLPAVT